MKKIGTFKRKKLIAQWVFLLMVLPFLSFFSCDKNEVVGPEEPQLPALTDSIPYDQLGSGTIVFERTGPYPGEYNGSYVIDVNRRKSWALYFPLASHYCVSPDGKKIAFTMYSGPSSAYDVYTVNINGTNLEKLDALEGQDRFPSWSPDGSKIFFWVEGPNPPALYSQSPIPNAPDLRLIREFLLTQQRFIIDPSGAVSVSVTGKIAYVCNRNRDVNLAGLYTIDMDGENLTLIVPFTDGRDFESPVFYPNGQKIAYLSVLRDSMRTYQKIDIMQVDVDGKNNLLLASLPANGSKEWADNGKSNSVYLTCSPDGSKFLVNVPEGDFVSHIYLLNADGSNLTQVTFAEGVTDRCVSWGR